jgi:uncharacterized protein YceK
MTAYGGVHADMEELGQAVEDARCGKNVATAGRKALFAGVDLPLSAVGDTLTLPIVAWATVERAMFHMDTADYGNRLQKAFDRRDARDAKAGDCGPP